MNRTSNTQHATRNTQHTLTSLSSSMRVSSSSSSIAVPAPLAPAPRHLPPRTRPSTRANASSERNTHTHTHQPTNPNEPKTTQTTQPAHKQINQLLERKISVRAQDTGSVAVAVVAVAVAVVAVAVVAVVAVAVVAVVAVAVVAGAVAAAAVAVVAVVAGAVAGAAAAVGKMTFFPRGLRLLELGFLLLDVLVQRLLLSLRQHQPVARPATPPERIRQLENHSPQPPKNCGNLFLAGNSNTQNAQSGRESERGSSIQCATERSRYHSQTEHRVEKSVS
eukprot:1413519-Rhodomonas_salina.2